MSSTPGEGKTTVAINLAAHFALHSKTRVLVIDADFHRRSLTNRIAPDARVGFKEALEEPTALAKFVVRKERLNLDVLPCATPDRLANAAELLGTAEMQQLIEIARKTYDLVIIEAPPMAAVVDHKMIARHCEGSSSSLSGGKQVNAWFANVFLTPRGCLIGFYARPEQGGSLCATDIEHYKGDGFQEVLH